jgi:hypothetical protein
VNLVLLLVQTREKVRSDLGAIMRVEPQGFF